MRSANVSLAFKRCGIPSNGVVGGCVIKQSHNYYWIVDGLVPLAIAEMLYANPVGRTDIRVDGHCGCPDPREYGTRFRAADGGEVVHDPHGKQEGEWDEAIATEGSVLGKILAAEKRPLFSRDAFVEPGVEAFVDGYHIDSELGLYLFVRAMKGDTL